MYDRERKNFSAPGAMHPVILFIDNDSGAKSVYGALHKTGKPADLRLMPFIHAAGNLYVVATPLSPTAEDSKMEDFFTAELNKTLVDGRSFDDSNNTDSPNRYGKMAFANKVVKVQSASIDFSGFIPLLDRIVAVIKEHQDRVAAATN